MKWVTHQTGALLGAAVLQMSFPAMAGALAGATLPDVFDQRLSALAPTRRGQRKVFNRIHRGTTHWAGWWLLIFLGLAAFPEAHMARDVAAGLAFGGLSHVFLDMLTIQGVPLLPFSRRFMLALRLCSTGRWSEFVFLGCMLLAGGLWLWPGFLEAMKGLAP